MKRKKINRLRKSRAFMRLLGRYKHDTAVLGLALASVIVVLPVTKIDQGIRPPAPAKTVIFQSQPYPKPKLYHPPHVRKVWTTTYKGRVFRVIQLPRCEHLEAVVTYDPSGETIGQAKKRMNGIAASTAGFCHSTSFIPADFIQRQGRQLTNARTGRWMFVIFKDGRKELSGNYMLVKKNADVTAIALGQRLVPLERDGFSVGFMNRKTDRMAVGMRKHFIYIVAGNSDVWTLSKFMGNTLGCKVAINCDGGHVVRGKSPVHLVFRWASNNSSNLQRAKQPEEQEKKATPAGLSVRGPG